MKVRKAFVNTLFKIFLRVTCRYDLTQLSEIPAEGPMLIAFNHINFLDALIMQVTTNPRKLKGFLKSESWNNPIMKFIADSLEAIPVDRGGVNMSSFKEVRKFLSEGGFVALAPEGTRSGDGVLLEGKAGITTMALMAKSPIIPMIHYGGEDIWKNLKRFKRTTLTFKVGKPFNLKSEKKPDAAIRQEMTNNIMYQMAELLPKEKRGFYSDISKKKVDYLEFIETQNA